MTRSEKTFDANNEDEVVEDIVITVAGKKFNARGYATGMDLMELIAASNKGGPAAVAAILDYLEDVLGEEQYQEFRTHVKEKKLDIKQLNEVAGYLIKEHSDRPTK